MLEEKYFKVHDKINPVIYKYKERLVPIVFGINSALFLTLFIFIFIYFDINGKVDSGIFHKNLSAWADTIFSVLVFFILTVFGFINYAYFNEDSTIFKIKYKEEEKSEIFLTTNNFKLIDFDDFFLKIENEIDKVGNVFEYRKYLLLTDIYEDKIFKLIEKEPKHEPRSNFLKAFKELDT